MSLESEQLLSDLVDGERVDPDALATALREAGAVEVLVDYARIHERVVDGSEEPSATFYQNVRTEIGRAKRARPMWRGLAAAAALVLCALGGAWIGRATLPPTTVSVPQVVHQTVERAPVSVTTPVQTSAVISNCAPVGPPKPDRVVLLTLSSTSPSGARGKGNTP